MIFFCEFLYIVILNLKLSQFGLEQIFYSWITLNIVAFGRRTVITFNTNSTSVLNVWVKPKYLGLSLSFTSRVHSVQLPSAAASPMSLPPQKYGWRCVQSMDPISAPRPKRIVFIVFKVLHNGTGIINFQNIMFI